MNAKERIRIIERSSKQVGSGVFYSTIVVITSFLPVFLLTGIEGKLFHPLVWTKTFILIIDAFLAITLCPVLISFFLKGELAPESANPVARAMEKLYKPVLVACLNWRKTVIVLNLLGIVLGVACMYRLGTEFMPPLDEGSILFMPVALPDVSNAEIKRILQVQDKIICSLPEVSSVLGKAGRANTATDNSPISMVETIIMLKPRSEWRKGVTKNDIVNELNSRLQIPGVVNGFTQPIINRINMLSTGIRTDVGLKIYGQNLDSIYGLALRMKGALEGIDGVKDLYVEPITGGRYLDIHVRKDMIGRFGLSTDDVNMYIESAIGGMNITTTIEGRKRYGVSVRLQQNYRRSIDELRQAPIRTASFGSVPLSAVADIALSEGPPMINSENAMLRGTVLFNVRGRDLGSTVSEAQQKLNRLFSTLPGGYRLEWSGQWENQVRATRTLMLVVPVVLLIIFIVLFYTFQSFKESLLIMITVPFALIGGVFLVYLYGVNLSVAVAVGFIALFGIAVETAMLMTIYLNEYMIRLVQEKGNSSEKISLMDLRKYIVDGAVQRLRPKLMTVSVSLFGLVPILWSNGTGSDVMLPITIPIIGGVLTSTIYVLLITPVVYEIVKRRELEKYGRILIPVQSDDAK